MDNQQIIEFAKQRFDHSSSKKLLKEKYQSKMIFAYNGGLFNAGPELLSILHAGQEQNDLVIEDLYHNPIKINVAEFRCQVQQRWQEQMNAWLVEYESLSRQR
jgi:hypothetical protein